MDGVEVSTSPTINKLSRRIWLCYGIGHVLNDICASIWFTYLLVFFHLVLKFDRINAGLLLLIGQIADGLSTTFIGMECNKSTGLCFTTYGKQKSWHLIGTLCVLGSFPFIFTPCLGCQYAHVRAQMVYYSVFVIIFQFGWAAVQISHLALVPVLTPHDDERTQLITIRYSFTVASTILIYILTWISLKSRELSSGLKEIGPNNAINFQRVAYIGLLIGLMASLVFHWGIKEHSTTCSGKTEVKQSRVLNFFKIPQFYQIAIIYMCSRLFVNIAQVYMPLYLHERWSEKTENIALVPLLMYIGSIGTSTIINILNSIIKKKGTYLLGSGIGLLACVWIQFGIHNIYEVYPVSIMLGVCGSTLVVSSLGFTAELIGFHTDTGAFVYGSMSFVDKVSNGIVVMVIQYLNRSTLPHYYQQVLVLVCGGAAILGILSALNLKFPKSNKETDITEETKPLLQDS